MLGDAEVRANIDTILIQGRHTDDRGSAPFNWDLSAERAPRCSITSSKPIRRSPIRTRQLLAGWRVLDVPPLRAPQTEGAYQKNRRSEISVVPEDEHVAVIDDYVQSSASAGQAM